MTSQPADAPDPGLYGPDSVTWRVHADPSMALAGLRALLVAAKDATHRGRRLAVCGMTAQIAHTVELAGFGDFFETYASRAEALAKLSAN